MQFRAHSLSLLFSLSLALPLALPMNAAGAQKPAAAAHAEAHAKALAAARARTEYSTRADALLDAAWQAQLRERRETVLPGKLVVRYQIRPDGKVESLQLLDEKKVNEGLKGITRAAFAEVRFPRMSKEVVSTLVAAPGVPAGLLGKEYSFTVTPPKNTEAMKKDGKSPFSLYAKKAYGVLAQEWVSYQRQRPVGRGTIRMTSYVRMDGKVVNVQVVDDTYAPPYFRDAATEFLRALKLPPMPPEVVSYLQSEPERERALQLPCLLQGLTAGPPKPVVMAKGGKSPLALYWNHVAGLLTEQWNRHLHTHDLKVADGVVSMRLQIGPDGQVQNVYEEYARKAPAPLREAAFTVLRGLKLPPLPAEVAAELAKKPKAQQCVTLPCTLMGPKAGEASAAPGKKGR